MKMIYLIQEADDLLVIVNIYIYIQGIEVNRAFFSNLYMLLKIL